MAVMVDIIVAIAASVCAPFATGTTNGWNSVWCGSSGGCARSSGRTYFVSFGISTLSCSTVWETIAFVLWNPSLSTFICLAELLVVCYKIILEVCPRLFDDGSLHPFSDIDAEDVMLRDDNESQIHYLRWINWVSWQFSYFYQVVNCRKNDINRLVNWIRRVFDNAVFGAQLLGQDLPVDAEEMENERAYFVWYLICNPVTERHQVLVFYALKYLVYKYMMY